MAVTCPRCAFENRSPANYCGRCGASVRAVVLCPRCASPNPSDYRFCDVCGSQLQDALGTPSDAVPPVVALPEPAPTTPSPPASEVATAIAVLDEVETAVPVNGTASADAIPDTVLDTASNTVESPPSEAAPAPVEPRWARPTASQARWLTLLGVALAVLGELYLQWADPSNRVKAAGLLCLVVAGGMFGVGARTSFLASSPLRPRLLLHPLTAVFQPGPPAIAAGVGGLAFVTLLGRLLFGSIAPTDLLLWLMSIAAFAMPIVGEATIHRPSRPTTVEIAGVAGITLAFVVLCSLDLNHWYYSAVGDEYTFFNAAVAVLTDGIKRPFVQDGVYDAQPMLGTVLQAAVMAVAGRSHAGWVFSSVLYAALAIPAVYLIGRSVAGPVVGLVAAALFASSHYLFAFSHIGYNTVLAQAPVAWSLALFLLSLRRSDRWLLYASGLAAGLGLYTFYSARVTILILALFVVAQYGWRAWVTPRLLRERLLQLWPLLLGLVLAAAPIFAASGRLVLARTRAELAGGSPADVTGPFWRQVVSNLWVNVPAFFQSASVTHYVSGSLLDPITAMLVVLGLGLAVRWWSNPACKLLLIWAGVTVLVTGVLSPSPTTAVTRLLVSVPPLCVLAALAAKHFWQLPYWSSERPGWATSPQAHRLLAIGSVAALLLVVLALNLQRFWLVTPRALALTQDAVVVGVLRSGVCGSESARTVVVMRNPALVRGALTSYGSERDLPRLVPHAELRPNQPIQLGDARCVVFGDPNDEPARRALDDFSKTNPGTDVSSFKDLAGISAVTVARPAAGTTRP
ncbi:MAG: zinc ribbon domain-containing protein [Chloroflexota bacterium]